MLARLEVSTSALRRFRTSCSPCAAVKFEDCEPRMVHMSHSSSQSSTVCPAESCSRWHWDQASQVCKRAADIVKHPELNLSIFLCHGSLILDVVYTRNKRHGRLQVCSMKSLHPSASCEELRLKYEVECGDTETI